MRTIRSIDEIIGELVQLQRVVGTLATDALQMTPSWRLLRLRKQLRQLEMRLAEHLTTFMNLDADLVVHASKPPQDINSAMRQAAWFQMYFGVRDSVRELLGTTSRTLGDHRNELAFRQSLAVAILALIVSIGGLIVGITV